MNNPPVKDTNESIIRTHGSSALTQMWSGSTVNSMRCAKNHLALSLICMLKARQDGFASVATRIASHIPMDGLSTPQQDR
ncbi:hypothetical protein SDC9_193304 [bioreactor metagenome]|uniref:Uncharacterized protein n=1 Tax=bioreactor metagenome TaxID=1076179 RepID=A0A645IBQ6_9ZZZZ